MMEIREIAPSELKKIYDKHMKWDFPVAELKPWRTIAGLFAKGLYAGYGLYEGETLLAYACFTKGATTQWYLLDYYAVCGDYRSKGYGSTFLNLLQEKCAHYQGVFAEIERVADGRDEAERETRQRRRDFYLRNGLVPIGIACTLFDVNYEMLLLPCAAGRLSDEALKIELNAIYEAIIPAFIFQAKVKLMLEES